jgi:hypothetical protein
LVLATLQVLRLLLQVLKLPLFEFGSSQTRSVRVYFGVWTLFWLQISVKVPI